MPRPKMNVDQNALRSSVNEADNDQAIQSKDEMVRRIVDLYKQKTNGTELSRSTIEARMKEFGITSSREFKRGRKKGSGSKIGHTIDENQNLSTNQEVTPEMLEEQRKAQQEQKDQEEQERQSPEQNSNAARPVQNDPDHGKGGEGGNDEVEQVPGTTSTTGAPAEAATGGTTFHTQRQSGSINRNTGGQFE